MKGTHVRRDIHTAGIYTQRKNIHEGTIRRNIQMEGHIHRRDMHMTGHTHGGKIHGEDMHMKGHTPGRDCT